MSSQLASRWMYRCCICFMILRSFAHPENNGEGEIEQLYILSEPCVALVKEIETRGGDRAILQCSTPSGALFNVPYTNTAWVREKQQQGKLFSGETLLDIPKSTYVDRHSETLILRGPPKLINAIEDDSIRKRRRLRNLEKVAGTKTVLVVRIQATNSVTTASEAQLASDVFGDNGDVNNLVSQYNDCSFGQLQFTKTSDRSGLSTNIQNGVVTISPGVSASVGDDRMVNIVSTELEKQFSANLSTLASHIMYCMPPGTMSATDVAYAWMNDYRSVYNDQSCSEVSTQMHEIGHNLNLGHSSHQNDEYGDQSGIMGYSYASDELPYMCFNSAKSWQLGWYSDKALTVTPLGDGDSEFNVKLASFVDYQTTNDYVVVSIRQSSSTEAFFINYNSAKGMHRSTQMGVNQVLITTKDTSNDANTSLLIDSMDPGDSYQRTSFNGISTETLTITFLSLSNDDVADISIVLSGSTVAKQSESPTIAPVTPAPTKEPSQIPTAQPTKSGAPSLHASNVPTGVPSISPSKKPTGMPSLAPSLVPSSSPSKKPTGMPSISPSSLPSITPSIAPSMFPSSFPSALPTKEPSMVPTSQPSSSPSALPSNFPSMQPSFKPGERESTLRIELASVKDLEKLDTICKATGTVVDQETKGAYGDGTNTKLTCSVDDSTEGKISVDVKALTYFPRVATAPESNEYSTYLEKLMATNSTTIEVIKELRKEAAASGESADSITTVVDYSADPPILIIQYKEQSSGRRVSSWAWMALSLICSVIVL